MLPAVPGSAVYTPPRIAFGTRVMSWLPMVPLYNSPRPTLATNLTPEEMRDQRRGSG